MNHRPSTVDLFIIFILNFLVNKFKTAAIRRLTDHRHNGGGTNWTWINSFISTVAFLKGNYIDENLVTQLLAKCVSDDNIRGGA